MLRLKPCSFSSICLSIPSGVAETRETPGPIYRSNSHQSRRGYYFSWPGATCRISNCQPLSSWQGLASLSAFLEELIVLTAADFGVDSHRVPGKTGVWTDSGKLASIGVGARRWVTMHGFALNVKPLLAGFNRINPCGIKNCPLTSLEQESDSVLLLEQVKGRVMSRFERLFIEWLPK